MGEHETIKQTIAQFCRHLNIAYQENFVRDYSQIGDSALYGGKHCGSDAEHQGSRFIAKRLKEIGLKNVELIPCQTSRFQFNDATLTVAGEERIIKPYSYVAPGTPEEGIRAELADAGNATKRELEQADVEGKVVLIAAMGTLEGGNLAGQMEEAIRHGAAALVICAVEDVLNEETIRVQPPNIISEIPIVGICGKAAAWLRQRLTQGACEVELKVDAEFLPNQGTTYNVVGEIPGKYSEEKIIYTAHLDHYFRCLQDNMASCAVLLGIAKGILDAGIQPNHTIVFAFHGSHETGGQDTRYPYIHGSYKLTHEAKPEWSGNALMNINFEYAALRQSKLQMLAYLGGNRTVREYFPYSPKLVGGFDRKVKNASQKEYYMTSWGDGISYLTAGIPTISNDVITEQLYDGVGPYVGRDHSNFDNWEAFDLKALEDTGRQYGGLGLFIDSLPWTLIDFIEQAQRIHSEINVELLKSLGMPIESYLDQVTALEEAAEKLNDFVSEKNDSYLNALRTGLTEEEQKQWFTQGRETNVKVLKAFKILTDKLEKLNQFDFLALATVKYTQNIQLMRDAITNLQAGGAEKVLRECLTSVDLCLPSYYFSEEVAQHMCDQICAPEFIDRRTWAANRELHVATHYDLMATFVKEMEQGDFTETIERLQAAIKSESAHIPASMAAEREALRETTEILRRVQSYEI